MTPFIEITICHATEHKLIPRDHQLQEWATTVLHTHRKKASLAIHLIDEKESALLNQQYRQKKGPTNILSFEFEAPLGITHSFLGDILLCPTHISKEITDPTLLHTVEAHWAHLVIHGCLHLLGYHHHDDISAKQMEKLEIEYLQTLGYPNPYE